MVNNRDMKSFGTRIAEKIPKVADTTDTIDIQAFRDPLRGERPHVQIFMNDDPNLLTWDVQLLSYWFIGDPAVFQDELLNLINNFRVITALCRQVRSVTQVQKSPR